MISEDVTSLKAFEGVALESNKTMNSFVSDYIDTENTQLYVIDSENNPTSEILSDGREVNPVFISENHLILKSDDKVLLTAQSEDNYRWYSTDESVAMVDKGMVTVKSKGTTNIVAETENGAKAICKICAVTIGDVNDDGKIDITDATLVQKCAAELVDFSKEQKKSSDTNYDDKTDITDATMIQKYVAEMINCFG